MQLTERTHPSTRTLVALFICIFAILCWPVISGIARDGLQDRVSHWINDWSHFFSGFNTYYPAPKNVIGVELGRSYSRAAIFKDDKLQIFTDKKGRSSIPSCVAYVERGPPLVGFPAKDRIDIDPKHTICDIFSLLGVNFSLPESKKRLENSPLITNIAENGTLSIKIGTNLKATWVTPEDVLSHLIKNLKQMATNKLKLPITHAHITIPSGSNDLQRRSVKEAAALVGLEVERAITNTIAASIAYGSNAPKNTHPCRPKVYNSLIYQIEEHQSNIAIIRDDGEPIPFATDEGYGDSAFANIVDAEALSSRACDLVNKVLNSNNLMSSQIEEIVFTGNPIHVTLIQPSIEAHLGHKARSYHVPSNETISPGDVIIRGIASAARGWESDLGVYISYYDVLPLSLGIEAADGSFAKILNNGTVIPTRKSKIFGTVRDGQEKVSIKIYEGERTLAKGNKLLGSVELENLPKRARGEVEVEVALEVDACYDLRVMTKIEGGTWEWSMEVELDYWSEEMRGEGRVDEVERLRRADEFELRKMRDSSDGPWKEFGLQKRVEESKFEEPPEVVKESWWSWLMNEEKNSVWKEDEV